MTFLASTLGAGMVTYEQALKYLDTDLEVPKEPVWFYRASCCYEVDSVEFVAYEVLKLTKHGGWIKYKGRKVFCKFDGRIACASKGLAMQRLLARTRSYLRKATQSLRDAENRYSALIGPPPRYETDPYR
jgi:hypothetical protein